MEITISRATLADLPRLAEVNRLAYMHETATKVAFTKWPAEKEMYQFLLNNLRIIMQGPKNHFFKATSAASGEILGFASAMLVEGAEDEQAPAPDPIKAASETELSGLNVDFMNQAAREIQRLKGYMKGQKYYYGSSSAVHPACQQTGIGMQLWRHNLDIADREQLPIFIIGLPSLHSAYARLGFEDVDHFDLDLNALDGFKYRGFGVYRQYSMLRRPRGVGEGDAGGVGKISVKARL